MKLNKYIFHLNAVILLSMEDIRWHYINFQTKNDNFLVFLWKIMPVSTTVLFYYKKHVFLEHFGLNLTFQINKYALHQNDFFKN